MDTIPRAGRPGLLAAALALCVAGGSALAAKTDVIYMRNGDRITCEIKQLERGQLRVSTDGMGTVYIEWEDIAQIVSTQVFIVEMQDGSRVQGKLAMPFDDGTLLVTEGEDSRRLEMASVVWVDPLKLDRSRIKRWDGSISAGFDKTKANDDTSLSGSFDARRRAADFQLDFDGSVYSRSQDDAEDTLRATLAGQYRGLLEDRWFWAGLGSFERNDEQGIDLRTLAGAGYGRFLVQTGRTLWSATIGLAVVNEQRAGDEDAETNIEALLNTEYEFFTYDTPKTSLRTSLTLFPSLTESGRVRSSLDVGLRHELIEDLFIELSVYDTYDSDPPTEGEKNDYGIVTSLGYTF
jgi:putative salt-induced outer membrane protein YdiY